MNNEIIGLEDIIATTRNDNLVVQYVDLADFTSVKEFAHEIIKSEQALHVLVIICEIYTLNVLFILTFQYHQ